MKIHGAIGIKKTTILLLIPIQGSEHLTAQGNACTASEG
jgi:hypothetical protein